MQLAEKFHWTLAEIDALTIGEISDLYETMDGRDKAAHYLKNKFRGQGT